MISAEENPLRPQRTAALVAGMSALLIPATSALVGPPEPALDDVLRRAGAYVSEYRDKLTLVCATETMVQNLTTRTPGTRASHASYAEKTDTTLVSDVLWVPSEDALVIVFFRDVWSVDGVAVRDRADRLLRLFPEGPSARGREQAAEILQESARHNLGTLNRDTNFPTFALTFLHPRNQPRFVFHRKGESKLDGRRTLEVSFHEVQHPTLTASLTGESVVAMGTVWLAFEDGAVLKTDLHFPAAGVTIVVRYALDPSLQLLVPQQMVERYGEADMLEVFEGVATYANYKRGDVEIGPIRYRR
jgi:hypothetical protein